MVAIFYSLSSLFFFQGSIFEPLSEEEVNRRKQAEEEKTRAKLEKINSKKEKKKQQAGMYSNCSHSIGGKERPVCVAKELMTIVLPGWLTWMGTRLSCGRSRVRALTNPTLRVLK